jgi:chromosomal replication initiator protein
MRLNERTPGKMASSSQASSSCEQLVNKGSNNPSVSSVWVQICKELEPVISPQAVARWLSPIQALEWNGNVLLLRSENSIYQYWIEDNYLTQLRAAASRVLDTQVEVKFAESAVPAAKPSKTGAKSKVEPDPETAADLSSLHPRYTFDSFVIGANSQFAQAAAYAVAHAPARTYNPLFLHGRAGLGKTHLMQAIGHYILTKKKHLKVRYVTSEQFTNEFIGALQKNEIQKFRRSYRQVDVLLIDDIQFLAGKDKSQEEFFHTFNALFDGSKQIVLTSDAPPGEIKDFEKRLTSRFEWGLTAEIIPPDQETRLAILRNKAIQMNAGLPDDILAFISDRVRSNVRRLEGALTRVAAYSALYGKTITLPQVETMLKDILQQEGSKNISIDLIQKKVAESYDIRLADMTSKRRPANIALPRMVAMYLSRKLTASSLNEIGEAFGGRDHGTVLHAQRSIEERCKSDDRLRQVVGYLTEKLSGQG